MAQSPESKNDGLEIERLFGAAIKPWGIPTFIGAFGAGIFAWLAGADPWILVLIVFGIATVLLGSQALRVNMARRGRIFSPWLIAIPIISAQLLATGFAISYGGMEGGLWFALTMISTVAGQSLDKKWALGIGALGALLVIAIALLTDQFDISHGPAIFAGSVYVFTMAGLANHQRTAAITLADSTNRDRIQNLETHNQQVEAIIGALQEGLVTTDFEGRVERWNKALETLAGRRLDEVEGKQIHKVLRLAKKDGELEEAEHPCVRARSGRFVAGSPIGEPERDLFLITDDEILIPVTVSAAPFPRDHDQHGVVAVITDVSRERGISEMRDALISLVSHELRTPLTLTMGFADLLADGAVQGEEAREYAIQIRDSTARLATMIEDLLTTAVIEAGELKLVTERVVLDELINTVVERFSASTSSIETTIPSGISVSGDAEKLEHVFSNLIGNSIKYSPENSPIRISARVDADEAVISVKDEGIGIEPELQSHIFERFTRSPDENVQRLPGTGLGLFIASEIAKAHGGSITVTSSPGSGSTFEVRLPIWHQA